MDRVVHHEPATPQDGWTALAGRRPRVPPIDAADGQRCVTGGARADSAEDYRLAMRNLATAVTIVTTRYGDQIHGMTASAVCCVSLDPPLLLVCIAKSTRTHRLITEGRVFAVHLLHQAQRDLADRFAGRLIGCDERFKGLAYDQSVTGAPVLLDCLAFLDCRVTAAHDGGDHTIFLGSVQGVGRRQGERPLIYVQGTYTAEFVHAASTSECGTEDDGLSVAMMGM